jgi:hypothetical protein
MLLFVALVTWPLIVAPRAHAERRAVAGDRSSVDALWQALDRELAARINLTARATVDSYPG